jgi:hypothetical protein
MSAQQSLRSWNAIVVTISVLTAPSFAAAEPPPPADAASEHHATQATSTQPFGGDSSTALSQKQLTAKLTPDEATAKPHILIKRVPPSYADGGGGDVVSRMNGIFENAPSGASVLIYTREIDGGWSLQPDYDDFDVTIPGGFRSDSISLGTHYAAILVGAPRPKMIGGAGFLNGPRQVPLNRSRSDVDKRRGPPRTFRALPTVGTRIPPYGSIVLAVDVRKARSTSFPRNDEGRRGRARPHHRGKDLTRGFYRPPGGW